MKELSIIITHYKTPRLLLKLLTSLSSRATSYPLRPRSGASQLPATSFEIIVVDSEAEKGLDVLIHKEFRQVIYLPFSKNVGYAKLVNTGVKRSKGTFLLILNADVMIAWEGIKKMLTFLKNHKEAGAVGVTDCFRFPTFSGLAARRSVWAKTPWGKKALFAYEMRDYERRSPLEVDWVRGDCWMIPRDAIKKVGLFNEHFFLYFEDTQWCRRAKEKGYAIYFLPGIKAVTLEQGASRQYNVKGMRSRLFHLGSFFKYLWNR